MLKAYDETRKGNVMKQTIMVTATHQGERYNGTLDAVADALLAKVGPDDVVRLVNADTGELEWTVGPNKQEYVPL